MVHTLCVIHKKKIKKAKFVRISGSFPPFKKNILFEKLLSSLHPLHSTETAMVKVVSDLQLLSKGITSIPFVVSDLISLGALKKYSDHTLHLLPMFFLKALFYLQFTFYYWLYFKEIWH